MKITPDFIPHNKFHKGSWLLPIKRPNWYYFKEQKNRNIITNSDFSKNVDGPLKELVNYLHKKGIKTTPSCAGHHIHEKNFEKIYDSLKQDKKDICKNGLVLEDSESGKIYIYKNKKYQLPWSKKIFLKGVMLYQQKGVIGIKLRNKKLRKKILKLNISEVKIKEKDSILFIFTANKNGNNLSNWKKITKKVKYILRSSNNKKRRN
ncbi:MAG: hypothetical protein K8R85_14540 [Bacteroidetes bacterium]|nr:hypothetical protein [Bacteroidota bacterium]